MTDFTDLARLGDLAWRWFFGQRIEMYQSNRDVCEYWWRSGAVEPIEDEL